MTALLAIALLGAWPFAAELPDDAVVASARGPHGPVTITAARLRAYAGQHPDRSPRLLAEELVDFKLLAAEARARGLTDGPDIREAADRVMVQRYLVETFEVTWSAAALPMKFVQQAYDRNLRRYKHPELRGARHVVITVKEGKLARDDPRDPQARRIAEDFARAVTADPPADADAFIERAKALAPDAEAIDLHAQAEDLGRFPREGRYVADFTKVIFEVTEAGQATRAFRTDFGWHVAFVDAVIPAVSTELAAAEREIRERIAPEVRAFQLRKLTDELAAKWNALVNIEPLGTVEERRTVP